MLVDPMSSYPGKVDDMTFFQDCDLENIHIMNTYNNLIIKNQYSEANKYINQQENICGYFAGFFNVIENRIYNLQDYLLHKPPKKQPFLYFEETDENGEELEPSEADENTVWI